MFQLAAVHSIFCVSDIYAVQKEKVGGDDKLHKNN